MKESGGGRLGDQGALLRIVNQPGQYLLLSGSKFELQTQFGDFACVYFDHCEMKGSKGDLLIDTGVGVHEVVSGI